MTRLVLTYGLISGAVVIAGIIFTMGFGIHSALLGYTIMLVALSSILVAVKQHRDQALGGVIRFWPALGLGLMIAVVASLAYVLVWEAYLAITHYSFMEQWTAQVLAEKRAAGVGGPAYEKAAAEMAALVEQYKNPLFRVPMTLMEIAPVGVLVAIAAAALLRNPKFLPARSRSA